MMGWASLLGLHDFAPSLPRNDSFRPRQRCATVVGPMQLELHHLACGAVNDNAHLLVGSRQAETVGNELGVAARPILFSEEANTCASTVAPRMHNQVFKVEFLQ